MKEPLKEPENLAQLYMSVQDVSALCHVSDLSVRIWIADGKLPGATKAGHRWLIPRESVATLLADRQKKT